MTEKQADETGLISLLLPLMRSSHVMRKSLRDGKVRLRPKMAAAATADALEGNTMISLAPRMLLYDRQINSR